MIISEMTGNYFMMKWNPKYHLQKKRTCFFLRHLTKIHKRFHKFLPLRPICIKYRNIRCCTAKNLWVARWLFMLLMTGTHLILFLKSVNSRNKIDFQDYLLVNLGVSSFILTLVAMKGLRNAENFWAAQKQNTFAESSM